MRISDWSSDVCSSDLALGELPGQRREQEVGQDEDRRCERGVQRLLLGAHAQPEQHPDDRLPVDVVVERAEALGGEERQEAALPEQLELAMARHARVPGTLAGASQSPAATIAPRMRREPAPTALRVRERKGGA